MRCMSCRPMRWRAWSAPRSSIGLATSPVGSPPRFTTDVMPSANSPYVSIKSLTGRSLRRLRVIPGRGRPGTGGPLLEWAGDAAQPGQQPAATPANGAAPAAAPAAPHYDDGFGPLPPAAAPPAAAATPTSTAPAAPAAPPATSQGLGRAPSRAMTIGIEDVDRAQRYAPQWRDLFNWTVPPAVAAAVEARGFAIQRIADAQGELNLDRYEVRVATLPPNLTAEDILVHFRQNIDDFLDTDNSSFLPYDASDATLIASANPVTAVWKIDIAGPKNAAVVISESQPNYFRVTTIHTPWSGDHPVTGHREFGFRRDGDATIFYTRAADRDTSGILESVSYAGADHLWKSFQRLFAQWINATVPGSATILPPFSERFHPEVVRILYGTAQGLASGPRIAGALSVVGLDYAPTDATAAANALAAFARRRDSWSAGVPDTRFMPHSAICHIEIAQADGQYLGTGFYVASDLILTAAHVVAQATGLTIYAGRNGASSWLKKFTASPADWSVYPGYHDDRPHDVAVIRVSTPPPLGQYFSLEEQLASTDDPIIVCGYAAQGVDPLKQHLDADWVRELGDNAEVMLYNLQTTGGTSGAPVFYVTGYEDEARQQSVSDIRVIGVHVSSGHDNLNEGCRLTAAKIAWIQGRGLVSVSQGLALAESAADPRARARAIGGGFAERIGQALDAGLAATALTPLLGLLERRAPTTAQARGLAVPEFSLQWAVDLLPQPDSETCWAAAAAMLMAWDQSGSPAAQLARARGAVQGYDGDPDVAATTRFADAVGLVAEPPQDYSEEGFRQLLNRYGPLWVGKRMASEFDTASHAVVVTGMYSDGQRSYLVVADPWDRAVGTPDNPGAYARTHDRGSRYVIGFDRFMREYDADQTANEALITMVLHATGTRGRTPNTDPVSLGQSYQPRTAPPPPAASRARAFDAPSPIDPVRRTDEIDRNGVHYSLQQLSGIRLPRTQAQAVVPLQDATVQVDDWPRMPDADGGTFAGVDVSWAYGGGQIGNVRLVPTHAGIADGWALRVDGTIVDGPDGETDAGITVTLRHRFSKPGEAEHRSLIRLILRGDGRHERTNEWEPAGKTAPTTVGA